MGRVELGRGTKPSHSGRAPLGRAGLGRLQDRQDLELDTNTPSLWSYITFVIAKDPTQPIFNSLYIPPPPG